MLKKLFNPKNEADLQALKEVLDDKTDFGFAGYKISKDDLIENLKGNDVIKPYWTKEQIDKAEFGKVIGQARDGYNNDLYVATKGNDVLYTPMVNHEYVRALTPEKISELIEKGTIREKFKHANGKWMLEEAYDKLKEEGKIEYQSYN